MIDEICRILDKFETYIIGNLIHQRNELEYYEDKIKTLLVELESQGINILPFSTRLRNLSTRSGPAHPAQKADQTEKHHYSHASNL